MTELMEVGLQVFADANCDDHPVPGIAKEDLVECLYAKQWCSCSGDEPMDCGSYCDREGAAVFKHKNGNYVVAWEWSDTSGHG